MVTGVQKYINNTHIRGLDNNKTRIYTYTEEVPMYVKLFSSMLESTIWMMPNTVLRVWLTLLLRSDAEGFVRMSIPGLALISRVSLDECREALRVLEEPDADSQSKNEEGRRIIRIGGDEPMWHIVNYQKYRKLRDEEQKREYARAYMKQWRDKRKRERKAEVHEVKRSEAKLVQEEEEAEEECINSSVKTPPTDIGKVLAEYDRGFTERTGERAVINKNTHPKMAKDLIRDRGLEKAMRYAYEFGSNPPRWNADTGAVGFEQILRAIPTLINRKV